MMEVNKKFCTGSSYCGQWRMGMNGFGLYTYPDGATYEGFFKNGSFHGQGILRTARNFKINGTFKNGKLDKMELFTFPDSLAYKEKDWLYCTNKDRRFANEIKYGIRPSGNSYLTKDDKPREIPNGCYDVENGFMDPINFAIFQRNNDKDELEYVRNVSYDEKKWAEKFYRNTKREPIGYNHDIMEVNLKAFKQYLPQKNYNCDICICSDSESILNLEKCNQHYDSKLFDNETLWSFDSLDPSSCSCPSCKCSQEKSHSEDCSCKVCLCGSKDVIVEPEDTKCICTSESDISAECVCDVCSCVSLA